MTNFIMRVEGPGAILHQKNWSQALVQGWQRWRLRRARHRQRAALRDLVDDPHLLEDIGVTREQALEEAERPAWDITHVRSL